MQRPDQFVQEGDRGVNVTYLRSVLVAQVQASVSAEKKCHHSGQEIASDSIHFALRVSRFMWLGI